MMKNEEKFVVDEKEPIVLVKAPISPEGEAIRKWNGRWDKAELDVGCTYHD